MTHAYLSCGKPLEDCRWCNAKAEKLLKAHGVDIQELDSTLTFAEQPILQNIQESEDDGIHNECARQLMGLGKKGSKRKPKLMEINDVLEGLQYMGCRCEDE